MLYFAYGSNMSLARLKARIPSAEPLGHHMLTGFDLRFHKIGQDQSGKCDAFFTGNSDDVIHGALYRLPSSDKKLLDRIEGVGNGYENRAVTVTTDSGVLIVASTYVATQIDSDLKPFSWYVNHVLVGAKELGLPEYYIQQKIASIPFDEDPDRERDSHQRAIHNS